MFQAVHMNHSLYSADRQTHRRIVGSAFVATLIITMVCVAVISKFEQQPAQPSVAVLRAGMPVATTDGGYFLVR
jgi:predicted permease